MKIKVAALVDCCNFVLFSSHVQFLCRPTRFLASVWFCCSAAVSQGAVPLLSKGLAFFFFLFLFGGIVG